MGRKASVHKLLRQSKKLKAISSEHELAKLLKESPNSLQLLAISKPYYTFELPKAKGGSRLIEAPSKPLKKIQKRLNTYLQALYFEHATEAAYGFTISVKNRPGRHLLANAERHLGHQQLINIDLASFFHQITSAAVVKALTSKPFYLKNTTARCICEIATHLGRLPMGAATSPALSNIATYHLDHHLLDWADSNGLTYTRFADDLSFSGNHINLDHCLSEIEQIIQCHRFVINPEKIQLFNVNDTKVVTGLYLANDKVEVPYALIKKTKAKIAFYEKAYQAQYVFSRGKGEKWVKRIRQQISGSINFIGMIYGEDHELYEQLTEQLDAAERINDTHTLIDWFDFPQYI